MKLCRLGTAAARMERFITTCCMMMGFIIPRVWSVAVNPGARKAIWSTVAMQTLLTISLHRSSGT